MAEGMPNFDPGAKLGKFPVWMWGAGLAGGVLVYTWANRQKDGGTAPQATLTDATGALPETGGTGLGGAGDGTQDMLSDFLANLNETLGGTTDPTGGTVSPAGAVSGIRTITATTNVGGVVSTLKTNQGWLSAATGFLASKGHSALGSERILKRYLAGKPLTQHQMLIVSKAIKGLGATPKGAPTVIAYKPPKKTIKVKPKKKKKKTKPKPRDPQRRRRLRR